MRFVEPSGQEAISMIIINFNLLVIHVIFLDNPTLFLKIYVK